MHVRTRSDISIDAQASSCARMHACAHARLHACRWALACECPGVCTRQSTSPGTCTVAHWHTQ
eukprot:12064875-Karenia_brevis.AAC.1